MMNVGQVCDFQRCGPSEVTFNSSNTNPANTVLWMNSSSEVLSSGNSFTTPIITANTDYYASVFTANNLVAPHTFGPATTLTGGFGNYTNKNTKNELCGVLG